MRSKSTMKSLSTRHMEMLRLMLWGWSNDAIAAHFGVSTQNVCDVRNSPLARRQLSLMTAARNVAFVNPDNELRKLVPKAIDAYKTVLEDPNAAYQHLLHAADQVLDRGHKPVVKNINVTRSERLTEDALARIKARARTNGSLAEEAEVVSEDDDFVDDDSRGVVVNAGISTTD